MDERNKTRVNIQIDLLLLELEEIRKEINHISELSDNAIPEFSKVFLLEDLKQYENYIIMKLTKQSDITSLNRN